MFCAGKKNYLGDFWKGIYLYRNGSHFALAIDLLNHTKLVTFKRTIELLGASLSGLIPLLLSAVGLFLSAWIIIPAPTFFSAAFRGRCSRSQSLSNRAKHDRAVACLFGINKGWLCKAALVCSVIGLIFSTLPLIQFPAANAQVATEMETVLGRDYMEKIPMEVKARMRSYPFILVDALRGISSGEVRVTRGIPFATSDNVTLQLNVYRPPQIGHYPAIVVVYGGAWREGSPNSNENFSRYMAARGYTVLAIDYRHAPQYRFPAQIEDVQTALSYIQRNANELEVDLERVALMGRSAGAHLALLAAYQSAVFPIRAVVDYYGPVDLKLGYSDPPVPDPINTRAVLQSFLGGTPDDVPDSYQKASPINYVTPSLPPSFLVYGARDHIVQAKFGRMLYETLRSNENRAVWLNIPWAEHAFDAVFSGVSNQLALYYTERFLAWATQVKHEKF